MFEVSAPSALIWWLATFTSSGKVPIWPVYVLGPLAVVALCMWLHDAGHVTFFANRIDIAREKLMSSVAAAIAAEKEQVVRAANSLWTTRSSWAITENPRRYAIGIWLYPPVSSGKIGVVNAACRVAHLGHGAYRGTVGVPQGENGLVLSFPWDFNPQTNSPSLSWPLPVGRYEIEWDLQIPGYVARNSFVIGDNGMPNIA